MTIIQDYFLNPSQRVYWLYLVSSLCLACIYRIFVYFARGQLIFKKQNLKTYWLHPSAILDYMYFILNTLIKMFILAPLLISAKVIALWVLKVLIYIKPDMMWTFHFPKPVVIAIYSFSLFIVSDFTRYWLHRWLHTVPFLWAFHKVHHSCEVLNPLSFYRVHPVENFLFGLRYSLSTGLVTGICLWLFGSQLGIWTIIGSNAFIFLFLLLGANLRHSHIYFYYPSFIEKFFISPAQHQLHHTAEFSNKNYGGYLGIWDFIFGSWQTASSVKKPEKYGFPTQMAKPYKTLGGLLLQPFIDILKIRRKRDEKINKK
ncbi:sterol desaturase family protein [Pasteurella skyensis]|uniref:Sterol desaturase family protein n=1 Tax=Phocoenobacter skyensis TaxID=97481 RepID=A0AAJ6NAY3_9PAST|nr:sterol desaturase family protein [Pasteurella skyensis]MDP8163194.1 sterol desaturase family protein [Pasteurella skyensis]MDP8173331.1 sterol desaturase family protein [Pasteurella skyensis]MDP8177745.1 sterol desaturase family protein [Pasteurella skyensis]MDP8179577.1 sterol desaturase family protein [Pasteurella skyensis]MDP8182451.1 sterol desaturase family protein [Pasteurella skyensis]